MQVAEFVKNRKKLVTVLVVVVQWILSHIKTLDVMLEELKNRLLIE